MSAGKPASISISLFSTKLDESTEKSYYKLVCVGDEVLLTRTKITRSRFQDRTIGIHWSWFADDTRWGFARIGIEDNIIEVPIGNATNVRSLKNLSRRSSRRRLQWHWHTDYRGGCDLLSVIYFFSHIGLETRQNDLRDVSRTGGQKGCGPQSTAWDRYKTAKLCYHASSACLSGSPTGASNLLKCPRQST